jgi:hypothetical protein
MANTSSGNPAASRNDREGLASAAIIVRIAFTQALRKTKPLSASNRSISFNESGSQSYASPRRIARR